jgi:PAS domain S-box-containing protein
VTEELSLEQQLEEAQYREIFDEAPVARLITDGSGRVIEANKAAAALFGAAAESLRGRPLASFVSGEDRAEFTQELAEAKTGTPRIWRASMRPAGREPFRAELHVVASARDDSLLHWALSDLTEHLSLQGELRLLASELELRVQERTREVDAEQARLAAVIEQIPAGLMIVGTDGAAIVGIPPGEHGRAELEREDGSMVVVDVNVAPITGAEGAGAVYLFHDVSEREQREQAERQFVTNAAHQLQSPLAGILSAVEVLQAGAKDGPEREIFLGHIERESIRLARLARALLILARAQTGYEAPKDEVVAVRPLLAEIAASLRPATGVDVEVKCPSDLAVITNRELMEQALMNVAENAAKYTMQGRIGLEGRADGDVAEFVVSDTGPGIPTEEQAHVVERFYRVEQNGADGFGLGFAIVRSALEALDGELEFVSREGVGTAVRMRVPRAVSLVET